MNHKLASIVCLSIIFLWKGVASAEILERPGYWAQSYVGRAADPSVRFGQLSNGLRYAVMRNETPKGSMSFRMRIGSGSLSEHGDQRGYAHFIEHMAFRGSKNIADGEVKNSLERHGLRFGADTNAFTTQDQTVFKFDFPNADPDSIETGLMLFREIANRLTIDLTSVAAERGVILSEERARDMPSTHVSRALTKFLYPGQLVSDREPIGNVEQLKTASASQLRAFYDANYRPANTTIIVIGDIDPAEMERAIMTKFGDWIDPRPVVRPYLGHAALRGSEAKSYAELGSVDIATLSWIKPYNPSADTAENERRKVIASIGETILNKRLEDESQIANPPFIRTFITHNDVVKSAETVSFTILSAKDKWATGVGAVISDERRLARDGVTQDELDRVVAQYRTSWQNAVATKASRNSSSLANSLVNAINRDSVFVSPEQFNAEAEQAIVGLTPAIVNAQLKDDFRGSGPLLFRAAPTPEVGGDEAVTHVLQAALAAPISDLQLQVTKPWPYGDFGNPGAVVTRTVVRDLGFSHVQFANGTRLIVRSMGSDQDKILIRLDFGHGRIGLLPRKNYAYWALNGLDGFVSGATNKLSSRDINHILESKVVAISAGTADNAFVLSGKTRGADFDLQMQLLMAYATDAGYRPENFLRSKSLALANLPQLSTLPNTVFRRDAASLLVNLDPRWTFIPKIDDVEATTSEDLPRLLRPELANNAFDITIVGDISVDRAIQAVAATFGTLPQRAPVDRLALIDLNVGMAPAIPKPYVFFHKGRADQAIAAEYWPVPSFYTNSKNFRALAIASAIIRARVYDELREKLGLAYSPTTSLNESNARPMDNHFGVETEITPEKIHIFYEVVGRILADIRDHGVSADEFERARQPLIDERLKSERTSEYWLGALSEVHWDKRRVQAIRDRVPAFKAITAFDVQTVVRSYLADVVPLKIEVRPETLAPSPIQVK